MNIVEILSRTLGSFIILLLLTRLLGRVQLSQLTFFNYITGITIGSIAASLAVDKTINVWEGLSALIGWAILTLFASILDIKSKKARLLMDGQPVVVVKEGKLLEDALRKIRLDTDELNVMLRSKNIFSIKDVDYAIIETSGQLSVLKKEDKQPIIKQDLKPQSIKPKVFPISTVVIEEGKIVEKALNELNVSKEWVEEQLNINGIGSIKDVVYAEVQTDGSLYIDKKEDNLR